MTQPTPTNRFYDHDGTPDLLESFAVRGRAQLENLQLGKHVRNNAAHYARAMCDETGQFRPDCFLMAEPQEKAAFDAKRKEIGELGINVVMTPELILKHLIGTEPNNSSLLNKVYHQAKDYNAVLPLERFAHPTGPKPTASHGDAKPAPLRYEPTTGSPELRARQEAAEAVLQKEFTDKGGNLKIEGFLAEPKWQKKLGEIRQQIASDLGMAMPVSPMHAVRQLLDDSNPRVGHDLREALIRHEKIAKPVVGQHTRRVAHVTDDPAVARKIHGDGAQRPAISPENVAATRTGTLDRS